MNLSSSKPTKGEISTRVLILGSGPAGLSAALYAARADLDPIVLTGMELGGQVSLTHIVENYPGFPEGVGGNELVELFQKQAERFGTKLEFDTASEVDLSKRPFKVQTFNSTYLADTLIISTGATSRRLDIPGETELTGRGVSYCATCDGWFFKDKDLIIVGGGDSALEESIFLTRYANSVTIVHRRDELRAGPFLQNRTKSNPKIDFIWNSIVTEILGEEAVESVRLQDVVTKEERIYPIDGIFIFIGHIPNTQLFKDQLDMDELGYLKVDHLMKTNVAGVFAAGEVADSHFRQVITSAGMGAAAAIQANHYLDEISSNHS
ncbi:MAG TPA: thioredoxin-disulfide reductase [Anaerolineales bacterium]|nr:thioredoxin-disulfide reductase [Anaerolineales bacterium]HUV91875.1 thioredoxin-disulfide reductase [Anaerolineales bacterium]